MSKVAVIIKHPYREHDWRVDIIDAPEDISAYDITEMVMAEMLGPFEVVGISRQINFDRKMVFPPT